KCCVSGAGALVINGKDRTMTVGKRTFKEGDWISLNGSTGQVMEGKIETQDPELSGDFGKLMELADKYTRMKVRTNADTPKDALVARNFGAQGIGLTRTEHMFFEGDRIKAMREMILADDETGRRKALSKLLPMQRSDFEGIFTAMEGLPVTVRLLDPPLHEFVPQEEEQQAEIAKDLGLTLKDVKEKVDSLHETNPMLGHRGCRLGNTYPEITEMQARAIIEAAINVSKKGLKVLPEIMVPLIGTLAEFELQDKIIRTTAEKVFQETGQRVEYLVGTMIEIPRAALLADKVAQKAEFFSFGTNDLTQMTFGYSRDDAGVFLPVYLEKHLLKHDPFQILDQEGVGQLVEMGTRLGRKTNPKLKVGICGEHGGEPSSVEFCHTVGMDYVSCSPYRVPIARLAAAMAAIR
ncbi:MAG: pyruvate, phosphate dikinase, partial [Candidatus Cloacimonetes bacterium]|nr:pyruvate, phosphate dikinase [Candidatus Cloacimonadota bacterium]MDY0173161.1 putative PEP-binding protein [Candidatus Cloacimonadaceae bacterium]